MPEGERLYILSYYGHEGGSYQIGLKRKKGISTRGMLAPVPFMRRYL
jgi:hypothetical protein